MHRNKLVVTAAGIAVLGLAVLALPSAAKQPKCLIVNVSQDVGSYASLQAAQDAASAGDTLKVKGTCYGSTTISKDLTIVGQSNPGFGTATLDGDHQGFVLAVPYQAVPPIVTVTGLTITGGTSVGVSANRGVLTLTNILATGNNGPGIANFSSATIIVNDSTVTGNHTTGRGGGIYNSTGTVTLNNTIVSDNTAASNGGGIFSRSVLNLNDSTVTGNTATSGGGIYNSSGTVTLTGTSTVSDNTATNSGGGIYNSGGTLVNCIAGSNVALNTPDDIAP
jgi:predicted outer membrane repeat protein